MLLLSQTGYETTVSVDRSRKMKLYLVLLISATAAASQDCQTPTQQPGKCVLINHCPHLFTTLLRNRTDSSKEKDFIRKSHCGFESKIFPKVCCPLEAVKLFEEGGAISHNQHSTKCGLHEPDGPSDPWLALLEYEKASGERLFLCSGVLINKRYVLTAAHCVKNRNLRNIKLVNVHLGKFNGDLTDSVVLAADGSTAHEDYDLDDPNQYNDIALVRLKNKVSFKDGFARPICIPMGDKKNLLGKTLSVTGYEKHGDLAKKRDGVSTIWNNSDCHLMYSDTQVKLGESQLCAGGRRLHYRHSYRMDLGGVLMHVSRDNSYSAVGILSLEGSCCGKENYPKVYTKVASYTEWILSNLKP